MSVYTPWAVLDFRKSDGQVPTPLCSPQDPMCMFGDEGRAAAWPGKARPTADGPNAQGQSLRSAHASRSPPCASCVWVDAFLAHKHQDAAKFSKGISFQKIQRNFEYILYKEVGQVRSSLKPRTVVTRKCAQRSRPFPPSRRVPAPPSCTLSGRLEVAGPFLCQMQEWFKEQLKANDSPGKVAQRAGPAPSSAPAGAQAPQQCGRCLLPRGEPGC